jgi:hypothetical protein
MVLGEDELAGDALAWPTPGIPANASAVIAVTVHSQPRRSCRVDLKAFMGTS